MNRKKGDIMNKKVYCKYCKYRSGAVFTSCDKVIEKPEWSKYSEECLNEGKYCHIRNNDNGDCEYFENKLIIRIFNKLFKV